MKGFSTLAKACWETQKENELSDKEMIYMLNSLKSHYQTNSQIKRDIDQEYLESLLKAAFQVISDEIEGDKKWEL